MKRLRKLAGIAGIVLAVFLLDYLGFYFRLESKTDVRAKYRAVLEKTDEGEATEEKDPTESLTATADAGTDAEEEKKDPENARYVVRREADVLDAVTESAAASAGNAATSPGNTAGSHPSEPELSPSETENDGNSNSGTGNR